MSMNCFGCSHDTKTPEGYSYCEYYKMTKHDMDRSDRHIAFRYGHCCHDTRLDEIAEEPKLGDVVRILNTGEPDEYGVVVCVYGDGDFAAISENPHKFWALCNRARWEPTGRSVDLAVIFDALKEIREEEEAK